MHGLSILYRWFSLLSVHISLDSLLPLSLNCAEWTRVGIEWLALWLVVYMAKKVFQWYFYVVTWTSSWDELCSRCWAKCCFSVVLCCRNLRSLWQQFCFFFLVHLLFNYLSWGRKTEKFYKCRLLKCWTDKDDIFFAFLYQEIHAKIEGSLVFQTSIYKKGTVCLT